MKTITVINLWQEHWDDCPMCFAEKCLTHSVGWYEEAVLEDVGTILPHGGEVGGMPVCKECHDAHYQSPAAVRQAAFPDSKNGRNHESKATTRTNRRGIDRRSLGPCPRSVWNRRTARSAEEVPPPGIHVHPPG